MSDDTSKLRGRNIGSTIKLDDPPRQPRPQPTPRPPPRGGHVEELEDLRQYGPTSDRMFDGDGDSSGSSDDEPSSVGVAPEERRSAKRTYRKSNQKDMNPVLKKTAREVTPKTPQSKTTSSTSGSLSRDPESDQENLTDPAQPEGDRGSDPEILKDKNSPKEARDQ